MPQSGSGRGASPYLADSLATYGVSRCGMLSVDESSIHRLLRSSTVSGRRIDRFRDQRPTAVNRRPKLMTETVLTENKRMHDFGRSETVDSRRPTK